MQCRRFIAFNVFHKHIMTEAWIKLDFFSEYLVKVGGFEARTRGSISKGEVHRRENVV